MPDMSEADAAPAQPSAGATAGPVGIGGWLILPMLGMFATIGVQFIGLTTVGQTFAGLSGLGGLPSTAVALELWINLALFLAAPIVLLILFFNRKRSFPRYFIMWQIAGAAFLFVDLLAGYALFAQVFEADGTPFFQTAGFRNVLGSIIGICIWVPYMLNSVRVRNTFVN